MNRNIIILLLLSFPLFSVEIQLNGFLYESYNNESLKLLSYRLPDSDETGIYLTELLPIMEEYHNFRFLSGDFIMETVPDDSLRIVEGEDSYYLKSSSIGTIPLPDVIEIEGIKTETEKLTIWFDREDKYIQREIDLFGRLHRLEIDYRIEKNLKSLLEYNVFNNTVIPDLIIYDDDKLNSLLPLLNFLPTEPELPPEPAQPFKISRSIYLEGASGGENRVLASDFGNLDLLYPLFIYFGLEGEFTTDSTAVKRSFLYLRELYIQGLYRLSENPEDEFISGAVDSIYSSSVLLEKININPLWSEEKTLPLPDGGNLPPLLSLTLLSMPRGGKNRKASLALLKYLLGYGVQQRINPQTGYLSYNRDVYPLLKNSTSKNLLMNNLENSQQLYPDDTLDKLRIVLPRIYRLIVSGRLTVDQGLREIENYLKDRN